MLAADQQCQEITNRQRCRTDSLGAVDGGLMLGYCSALLKKGAGLEVMIKDV